MPYRKGRPLIDSSIFFRVASALTFYPILIIGYSIFWAVYRSSIFGRTKLKKLQKAVLVSNHTTFLDPLLMSAVVYPRCTYHTLLEETVLFPYLGTLTRLLGGIPVPFGMRALHNLPSQCVKAFKYRKTVHFYPEGECFLNNQTVREFHPGAFLVSAELNVPVVPLATVFNERSNGKRAKINLFVLDPIYPSDFDCINKETGKANLKAVRRFGEHVRSVIQAEIDKRGGTNKFYKGQMERIAGING